MKKTISFTAFMEIETDDWDIAPKTFDEVEDTDYDNVGRPINDLIEVGWCIKNKKMK